MELLELFFCDCSPVQNTEKNIYQDPFVKQGKGTKYWILYWI